MTQEINPDLVAAVREMGRLTTPEKLKLQGVRHLRSVGVAEVSLLIEKAVNRTLMKRTIGGLEDEELRSLVAEAEEEFTQQLTGLQALADSRELVERHKQSIQGELAGLRQEIAARRGFVEQRESEQALSGKRTEDELRDLRLRIQALILPVYDAPSDRRPTVRRLAEDLLSLFVNEETRALTRQRQASEREITTLERRITKLVASLENTERMLESLSRLKDVELGVASIYRTVQGLSETAGERQLKQALLDRIYQSNLELRGALPDLHADAPAADASA